LFTGACFASLAANLGKRGDEHFPAVSTQLESFQQLHTLRADIHFFNLLHFGNSLSRLLRLIGIDQKTAACAVITIAALLNHRET
jgi:hypothetical protein